jgi:hypothetical protein
VEALKGAARTLGGDAAANAATITNVANPIRTARRRLRRRGSSGRKQKVPSSLFCEVVEGLRTVDTMVRKACTSRQEAVEVEQGIEGSDDGKRREVTALTLLEHPDRFLRRRTAARVLIATKQDFGNCVTARVRARRSSPRKNLQRVVLHPLIRHKRSADIPAWRRTYVKAKNRIVLS